MSYYNTLPQAAPAAFSGAPISPSQPTGKRRKISTACSACQHRKTKCSGGKPCSACVGRASVCLYDINSDQRRKVAVHRNLQDLTDKRLELVKTQQILGGILAVLRAGSAETIKTLLLTVQSGIDLSQVAAHVRNAVRSELAIQTAYDETVFDIDSTHNLPSASSMLSHAGSSECPPTNDFLSNDTQLARSESRSDPSTEGLRGQYGGLAEPIVRVPARPWTTVTDDDYLVSHLVSLWLTWTHPWWHWIDRDNFVEAMQQRDITSPLCTVCIVNMILADACLLDVGNDMNPNRLELSERFYNEGVKCMADISERPASMGLVSALGVQWTYLNTVGDDKHGLQVLDDQLLKAEDLDTWRQNLRLPSRLLRKVDISLDRLAWTLYTLKGLSLMSLRQLEPPKPPTRPKPVRDCIKDQRHDHNPNQPWVLYPTTTSRNFHYECHYSCFLSLAETICTDEGLLRNTGVGDQQADEKFEESVSRLQKWPQELPDCMQLTDQSTPHVIALHAVYLWALVNILKQANASGKGRLAHPELMEEPSDRRTPWTTAAYETSIRISELLMTHSWLWGVQHFPVILIRPISLSLFILLGDLSDVANARAFTNLCFWTYSVSTRLRSAEGILDQLSSKVAELGIEIPQEAREYLTPRQAKRPESPEIDVEYLLGKWDDFDLGPQSEAGQT